MHKYESESRKNFLPCPRKFISVIIHRLFNFLEEPPILAPSIAVFRFLALYIAVFRFFSLFIAVFRFLVLSITAGPPGRSVVLLTNKKIYMNSNYI